jgi:4-hydroxy-tetrahydrodipicolinate reductase
MEVFQPPTSVCFSGGKMVNIVVSGCLGKMGRRIVALAVEDKQIKVSGAIEAKDNPCLGKDVGEVIGIGKLNVPISPDAALALSAGDVLIEFTTPKVAIEHLKIASDRRKAAVIGTTGLVPAEVDEVKKAARFIPIVFSPNMSIGVNLLFDLVAKAASNLKEGYDVEIVEVHHRLKKDSPSGTALKLAQIVAETKELDLKQVGVHGRSGISGPRPSYEIGIHAVRAGDIVGEHTVIFAGTGERLEFTHRAHSRDTFAQGALTAAKFVYGRAPRLYDMKDVLGI